MSLERVLLFSLCILVLSGLVGCRETEITDNEQITTYSGDIVLYSGDKIVVLYGSNSWAYIRLGKMNIQESDVTELLSNGDITLKMAIEK